MISEAIAAICLSWYCLIAIVCTIGYVQIFKWYSQPPPRSSIELSNPSSLLHVTIIRPVKGLDPGLYDCLRATFLQSYPKDKLTVCFCVPSLRDASIPVLRQLLQENPDFDAKIYAEDEDPDIQAGNLGPNPKIRQVARAFREAKGDIIWAIDCNVWVPPGTCGRMVSSLCGSPSSRPYKFVHQLPLVASIPSTSSSNRRGSRLEEMFTSSSHAKFYTAINTVSIAPCIVGKSNMFRRSHLDILTHGQGLAYFSNNICEDHLIGDLLWKSPLLPAILDAARSNATVSPEDNGKWRNHGLVLGDLAIQPMADMSVTEYIARRVRWLRVRKFTVLLATLVEPGTESFLCSLYGAFAATTLPFFHARLGIPQTWIAFWTFWLLSVSIWAIVDWTLYAKLHSSQSIDVDEDTPSFARRQGRKSFAEWITSWLGRETLAFPIWFWAFYCGSSVEWRGKKLWVGWNMKVHEIDGDLSMGNELAGMAVPLLNGQQENGVLDRRKDRRD